MQVLLALVGVFAFSPLAASQASRVYSAIKIHDYPSACTLAEQQLNIEPCNQKLWKAYLDAAARLGNEKKMVQAFEDGVSRFPEMAKERDILETMAWGIVEKGARANSPATRSLSLAASFFSGGARGVEIIRRKLFDKNEHVRVLALRLAANFPDICLQEDVYRIFVSKTSFVVRLEAIRSVGKMKIKKAKNALCRMITDSHTGAEEKAAATESLSNLFDTLSPEALAALLASPRAELRQMSCNLIAKKGITGFTQNLTALLADDCANVRASALFTLGFLREGDLEMIEPLLNDPHPMPRIAAAWVLTIRQQAPVKELFMPFFFHTDQQVRVFSAAVLASTGKYGIHQMEKAFETSQDPFVKLNLAVGLLSQRKSIEKAANYIYQTIKQSVDLWMWDHRGNFRMLSPSKVTHSEIIPNQPETVNLFTKLELLNILAIVNAPEAKEAILEFLQKKHAGISSLASALLLTEGDEEALQYVQKAMQSPIKEVRIQSAFILALWGGGEDAINVLQTAYSSANYEERIQILEGLGRLGSALSIPFLTERLKEAHQTIRIIAASSLLQCLYH